MADDILTAMLTALDKPRTPVKKTRTPDGNHPFTAPPQREERRGQKAAHRDPTGNAAVGNIHRQEKK